MIKIYKILSYLIGFILIFHLIGLEKVFAATEEAISLESAENIQNNQLDDPEEFSEPIENQKSAILDDKNNNEKTDKKIIQEKESKIKTSTVIKFETEQKNQSSVSQNPIQAQVNPGDIVINEVVTDPRADWGGNNWSGVPGIGTISSSDEYLELYNKTLVSVNLTSWSIIMTDSTPATENFLSASLIFSKGGSLTNFQSGEYLIVGNPSGSMNNDVWIELKDNLSTVIDDVTLGTWDDGNILDNAPSGNAADLTDETVSRDWLSTDTNIDSDDFSKMAQTMGKINDKTKPIEGKVFDGDKIDIDQKYTNSKNKLSANWSGFKDLESGISSYKYALIRAIDGYYWNGTDWQNIEFWFSTDKHQVNITGLSLEEQGQYYFKVKAINGVGLESDSVDSDGVIVDSIKPQTPIFANVQTGPNSISLEWLNIPDAKTFEIWRESSPWTLIALLPGSQNQYLDTNVQAGKTYIYRIFAQDEAGNRSEGAEVVIELPLIIIAPEIQQPQPQIISFRTEKEVEEISPQKAPQVSPEEEKVEGGETKALTNWPLIIGIILAALVIIFWIYYWYISWKETKAKTRRRRRR